jgi:hypothetical protein
VIRGKDIDTLKRRLARWGFAAAVIVAAVAGLAIGATVAIPLILALQNRAFTEFGAGGVRSTSLVSKTLTAEHVSVEALMGAVEQLERRREGKVGD